MLILHIAAPAAVLGSKSDSAVYAKSLAESMSGGTKLYQSMLRTGAFRLRQGLRDRFLSATDLLAKDLSTRRISTSESGLSTKSTKFRETAAHLVEQLDTLLQTASSTLASSDAGFSPITLTRGAIVTSLRFCLNAEVYFQPVSKWVGLVLSFLEFLSQFTLEHFTKSTPVQAIYLNTYCYLWYTSQRLADFFLDDFDREIQIAHNMRWEKG